MLLIVKSISPCWAITAASCSLKGFQGSHRLTVLSSLSVTTRSGVNFVGTVGDVRAIDDIVNVAASGIVVALQGVETAEEESVILALPVVVRRWMAASRVMSYDLTVKDARVDGESSSEGISEEGDNGDGGEGLESSDEAIRGDG